MKIFTLTFLLFFLVSCAEQKDIIIDYASTEHKHLSENKKLWETTNLKNYSFVVQKSCFCPQEEKRQISVKNTQLHEAKYIPSNTPLNAEINVKKIEDYFTVIQDALDKNAYKITVTYDKTYGFPSDIAIDYDEQMADEEVYYSLTHFVTVTDYKNAACTKEYMPVCGKVTVSCDTRPCETTEKEFSNNCMLNANPNAIYLRDGEC